MKMFLGQQYYYYSKLYSQGIYNLNLQMFDHLKNLITHQNLIKVKANQQSIDHFNKGYHNQDQQSQSQDDDLVERISQFKILMEDKERKTKNKQEREHYSQAKIRQYKKERDLFQQEMRITKEMHQRQLYIAKQIYQRELSSLKIEISKHELIQRKHNKQQGIINGLKKDNRRLIELHQDDQKIVQQQAFDLSNLKKEIFQLKMIIKKKQEKQAQYTTQKHIETSLEIKQKEQKDLLQKQKAIDHQKRKQLQQLVHRLRQQKDELLRQAEKVKIMMHQHEEETIDKYKLQITRIQSQNKELKKRNITLEESFIQHLTQTSLNLQQTLKNVPQKINKSATLCLPESPIRARSRDNERIKALIQNDNPERWNTQRCKCGPQLIKLKSKLNQANTKIVELLKQKCLNQRK